MKILQALLSTKLCKTMTDVHLAVRSKNIFVNNAMVTDMNQTVSDGDTISLRPTVAKAVITVPPLKMVHSSSPILMD